MNLIDVMDELGGALGGIAGLRVFPYPPETVTPPAAIVAWPDSIDYAASYGRGMDRLTIPIVVVVGKVSARASALLLGEYADGSGARSVKAVVDGGTYTAMDSVTVTAGEFDVVTMAGVDYLAALFEVDVVGSGS